jgi:hypothetical protein
MAGSSADVMSHGDSYVLAERTITPKYPGGRDLVRLSQTRPPDAPVGGGSRCVVQVEPNRVDEDELHLPAQVRRHLRELGLAVTGQHDPPDSRPMPGKRIAPLRKLGARREPRRTELVLDWRV